MKRLALSLLLLAAPASAQRLAWDPNSAADNVTRYEVSIDGSATRILVPPTLDPTLNLVATGDLKLSAGTHTAVVRAVNAAGASPDAPVPPLTFTVVSTRRAPAWVAALGISTAAVVLALGFHGFYRRGKRGRQRNKSDEKGDP